MEWCLKPLCKVKLVLVFSFWQLKPLASVTIQPMLALLPHSVITHYWTTPSTAIVHYSASKGMVGVVNSQQWLILYHLFIIPAHYWSCFIKLYCRVCFPWNEIIFLFKFTVNSEGIKKEHSMISGLESWSTNLNIEQLNPSIHHHHHFEW